MTRLLIMKMKLSQAHYQYRRKKEEFLYMFSSIGAWGNYISMDRLRAFGKLFEYLDDTRDLIEEDENLREVIYKDNVDLLLGKLTPMPPEVKGSLSGIHHLCNREKLMLLCTMLRSEQRVANEVFNINAASGHVSAYCEGIPIEYPDVEDSDAESDSAPENDFAHVSAKLRRMRGCLYKKSKSGFDVSQNLLEAFFAAHVRGRGRWHGV